MLILLNFVSILLILVILANQFQCQEDICTIEDFRSCLKLLQSVGGDGNDLALPVNRMELNTTCKDLKEGVQCLDLHIQKCFSPEMQQVYVNIASNAKQFVQDLCDNRIVQNEFLEHAKCFREVSLDVNKCATKYKDAETIGSDLEGKDMESLDKEAIMKKSCCALREFVQCKRTHVWQWCGARAATFMQKHLQRITNPIMDEHCSAYTFGHDACANDKLPQKQQELLNNGHGIVIHSYQFIIWVIIGILVIN